MKIHLNDLLLLGLISFTYWVHVLSQQGQQAYPPGVPPPSGVPPQQYQQQQFQQHPPQYQQAPPQMQYQQHPGQMQYQQPPPQMMHQGQYQQPPPHMQQQQFQPPPGMPQQQQYHGQPHQAGRHHPAGHSHDFKKESHDREHIADHLKDVVNKPVEQMTEEEMEFHYFKLHDYDNNNKLDGTEITKALTHFEREGHHDPAQPVRTLSDDEIAEIVDAVLKEDDLTGDGYVEYSEFVVAQRKARGNTPSPPKAQDHPSGQH